MNKSLKIFVSRFFLKKNSAWNMWRIYPYSSGWFYKSREFPGLNYIEIKSGYGGGIFIGKTKTDLSNNYDVQDMKKSMDLPAPTDPILTLFGRNYEDCNPSLEFNMDDEVSRKFHQLFSDDHGCHIPFLGGDRYVTADLPQNKFCTQMADYNTTQGEQFLFLVSAHFLLCQ